MSNPPSKTIDNLQATIERLRRELEFARQETKRVMAEAKEREDALEKVKFDADSKKNDVDQLRMQAEDVARRKKLQEKVIQLQEEILSERQAREALSAELEQHREELTVQREQILIEAQEEIIAVRSQAKEAWRRAEEEIARLDTEIDHLKVRLENEKKLRTSAENTMVKLEATLARIRHNTSTPANETLDKQHFDNLLKKAHLAIKSLQEQLTHTAAERDQYLAQANELRAALPAHSLRPGGNLNPVYVNITPKEKPSAPHVAEKKDKAAPLNLNQPLFDDDINDELLLLEPDQSFERDDESLDDVDEDGISPHSAKTLGTSSSAGSTPVSSSAPTDRWQSRAPAGSAIPGQITSRTAELSAARATPSSGAARKSAPPPSEDAPTEQSIAELARELLKGSRALSGAPITEDKRQSASSHQHRYSLWQTRIDAVNLSWRRIGWASLLSFIMLVIGTAVYDRFFGEGLRRAEFRAQQTEIQQQVRTERRIQTRSVQNVIFHGNTTTPNRSLDSTPSE